MLRKSLDDLDINGQKGDWCFLNDNTWIGIRYGDTCFEGTCVIPIHPSTGKLSWHWNGSVDLPTIEPSIAVYGNGRENPPTWHGWLRDGKLVLA